MEITEIPVPGYEKVVRAEDPVRGFRAMVAVHDTTLGPSLGGMRMWAYSGWEEAQRDVLRLSRGMTYKSAVAQTGLGGGKSVILADARTDKSDELFTFMGKLVDSLGGTYITAEDVGIAPQDLDVVARETKWVTGRAREVGGSGDPSPYTALGTYVSIEESLREKHGSPEVAGKTVAIQGLGHVGFWLAKHLHEAGAKLIVCDLHTDRTDRAARDFGATVVDAEEILRTECDVLSPCALGAVLNDETIPALRTQVVCGAANNQLAEERHGLQLREAGVLYAPDYVVNAGGILNISVELEATGYDEQRALAKVETIRTALQDVFQQARQAGVPTAEAADQVAEGRLAAAKSAKGA